MEKIYLQSSIDKDGITRVVLHTAKNGTELVTHLENMQCGGYSHGHYLEAHCQEAMLLNYIQRCKSAGVNPLG